MLETLPNKLAFVNKLITFLPLKRQAKFVVNDIHFISEKTNLDISCESSAKQTIHMKCLDLFSLENKNEKKKKKMSSAAVVIGALRANNKQKNESNFYYQTSS